MSLNLGIFDVREIRSEAGKFFTGKLQESVELFILEIIKGTGQNFWRGMKELFLIPVPVFNIVCCV